MHQDQERTRELLADARWAIIDSPTCQRDGLSVPAPDHELGD